MVLARPGNSRQNRAQTMPRPVERPEDIGDYFSRSSEEIISRALALAPLLDQVDRQQARRFIRMRAQAIEQRIADTGDVGYRRYIENVKTFLDQYDFTIGRSLKALKTTLTTQIGVNGKR